MKAWPARGPKAKGWGEFLRKVGIADTTAGRYMSLAGYVSSTQEEVDETSDGEVPTYAEAGIKKAALVPLPAATEMEPEPVSAKPLHWMISGTEGDVTETPPNRFWAGPT